MARALGVVGPFRTTSGAVACGDGRSSKAALVAWCLGRPAPKYRASAAERLAVREDFAESPPVAINGTKNDRCFSFLAGRHLGLTNIVATARDVGIVI